MVVISGRSPYSSAFGLGAAPSTALPNLQYNGGAILPNPNVADIYVGGYWQTGPGQSDRSYNDAFSGDIVKNPAYNSLWAQYGVGQGSFLGSTNVGCGTPSVVTDSDIQRIVLNQKMSGKFGDNPQTIYTVYLPPGTVLQTPDGPTSLDKIGGYHGSFRGPDGKPIYYAAIAYGQGNNGIDFDGNPRDALSIVASHEWTEAATDPNVSDANRGVAGALGWYDQNYGEIGDIPMALSTDPRLRDVWSRLDGFAVQKEWSNFDGRAEIAASRLLPFVL
jgi:hypothetical protein